MHTHVDLIWKKSVFLFPFTIFFNAITKKSRDLSSLSSSVTLFSYVLYCTFYLKVDLTKINVRSDFFTFHVLLPLFELYNLQ